MYPSTFRNFLEIIVHNGNPFFWPISSLGLSTFLNSTDILEVKERCVWLMLRICFCPWACKKYRYLNGVASRIQLCIGKYVNHHEPDMAREPFFSRGNWSSNFPKIHRYLYIYKYIRIYVYIYTYFEMLYIVSQSFPAGGWRYVKDFLTPPGSTGALDGTQRCKEAGIYFYLFGFVGIFLVRIPRSFWVKLAGPIFVIAFFF